MFTLLS